MKIICDKLKRVALIEIIQNYYIKVKACKMQKSLKSVRQRIYIK